MVLAAGAALATGLTGTVMAEEKSDAAAADGSELYIAKGCAGCHGTDGKTTVMPMYPKVAGQNAIYIEQQMKDIRDGKRINGLAVAMKPMVSQLTDQEMEAIAGWLSDQE